MVQFYFNAILPKSYPLDDLLDTFETCFRQFLKLRERRASLIDHALVIDDLPSRMQIAQMTLLELLLLLKDKELKRHASATFGKYPLNDNLPADFWEDADPLTWDYVLNGEDATNPYLASLAGWILYSIPMAQYLTNDTIEIEHRINETKVPLINFYGVNIDYIVGIVDNIESFIQSELGALKHDTFGDKQCLFTPKFEENYKKQLQEARKLINNRFKFLFDNGWLFPELRVDNINIKECESERAQGVYELRHHSFNGLRVYFTIVGDTIYLGDVQTKRHSGDEQTTDMNHAKKYIDELKANKMAQV